MASIYLIRHGQASFGEDNYDALSDLGKAQAQRLGESLCGRLNPDLVIQGTMVRHGQTAEHCLASFDYPGEIEQDPQWNEYDHQAVLAGVDSAFIDPREVKRFLAKQADPKKAFHALFSQAIANWQQGLGEYPESWPAFKHRVEGAMRGLVERLRQGPTFKQVVVFTSGGPISCLSQALLGVPEDKLLQLNWTLVNGGVTKLVVTSDKIFLASLNEHAAFEGQHAALVSYR